MRSSQNSITGFFNTQVENAMQSFYDKFKPHVELSVSATLLGVLLNIKDKKNFDKDNIIVTTPSDDHVDIEYTRPLVVDGQEQYLYHGDLKPSNGYRNTALENMIRDGSLHNRSLHIAMISNRVNTDVNNTDCAESAQMRYPSLVIATMDGSRGYGANGQKLTGYKYRLPYSGSDWQYVTLQTLNDFNERHGLPQTTVVTPQNMISIIDETHLEAPLIMFCYRAYFKGFSIRSSQRACTHLTGYFGRAISLSLTTQAHGRAQGEQKQLLADNGFDHVKILTIKADYESVRAHNILTDEVMAVLEQDGTLETAFRHQYSADADAFLNHVRTICAKNTGIELPPRMTFKKVTAGQRFINRRTAGGVAAVETAENSDADADDGEPDDDTFLDVGFNPNRYAAEEDATDITDDIQDTSVHEQRHGIDRFMVALKGNDSERLYSRTEMKDLATRSGIKTFNVSHFVMKKQNTYARHSRRGGMQAPLIVYNDSFKVNRIWYECKGKRT